MNGTHAAIVSLALLAGCAAPTRESGEFRLWDFEQGLLTGEPPTMRIYQRGNEFTYAVNGECVVNHETRPCMWHGLAFSYESPTEVTTLECVVQSDLPTRKVNPEFMAESATTSSKWRIRLEGREGRKVHSQYYGQPTSGEAITYHQVNTCAHEGRQVLSYEMTVHFPGK